MNLRLFFITVTFFLAPIVYSQEKGPSELIELGEKLEKTTNTINADAEKTCFKSPKGIRGAPCMNNYVKKLNETYGDGAFKYSEELLIIQYTGIHYRCVIDEFPKSDYVMQAKYLLLTKNLIGHPDEVLSRIKEFLSECKKGPWCHKGILLWARINEDIWWIHRKWSWVIYNWQLSPEELIVKAEPYRQEALSTFQKLIEDYKRTEEAKLAREEYDLLKNYKDDGKIYGIVNEASIEGAKVLP